MRKIVTLTCISLLLAAVLGGLLGLYLSLEKVPPPSEWPEHTGISNPLGNLYLPIAYNPDDGLQLQVRSSTEKRLVEIHAQADQQQIYLYGNDEHLASLEKKASWHLENLPAKPRESVEFLLKMRTHVWQLFLDGNVILTMASPFADPASLHIPQTAVPPSDKADEPFLQRVQSFAFADSFLVPEGQDKPLRDWESISGQWVMHTAVDNSIERHTIRKGASKKPEPARSPNFYSVLAKGSPAVLLSGHYFYDCYDIETAVQTAPGEMGLIFYAEDSGAKLGYTMTHEAANADAILRLWRQPGPDAERQVIAAARTKCTPQQWIKLKVRTFPQRIQCFVDDTRVIDIPYALPPGGRFGLLADSTQGIRFDDVKAASNKRLRLQTINDIRAQARFVTGDLLHADSVIDRMLDRPRANLPLNARKRDTEQHMVIGSIKAEPHVFAGAFEINVGDQSRPGKAGILAGYTGPQNPYYRFGCEQTSDHRIFTLEKVTDSGPQELERLALTTPATNQQINLAFDATDPDLLKLYNNDKLVLLHHTASPCRGASGVYVAPQTEAKIFNLEHKPHRRRLYRNQYEKNRIFVNDPFMRHWSSPEGQWLTDKNGLTWHKSDFFGRFLLRLPFNNQSEVHMGVKEGRKTGTLILKHAADKLVLYGPAPQDDVSDKVVLGSAPLSALNSKGADEAARKEGLDKWFTIQYEGHWVWVTSGDELLFKSLLERPLSGRRIRLKGFSNKHLKYSYVERYRCKDFLFNESLHDWVINGGTWGVVNRFQCQPRWSHMNGEFKHGLAALWSKYQLVGDFCIELYAGMRHQWYDRPGDLNLTCMNNAVTPSSGYSLTCTGWDPGHTQKYTRLYRNGKQLTASDKYTVPRIREGKKRRGYNPLLESGRDLHGAWYYIKLRKQGKRIQCFFDNELVFETTDKRPLSNGGFGIWTFMNSMMVARVKAAAQNIKPQKTEFEPLPLDQAGFSDKAMDNDKPSTGQPENQLRITLNRTRANCMTPACWSAETPSGHGKLKWHKSPGGNYWALTNVLGGSRMAALCKDIPAVPLDEIAGWTFDLKATPQAQFNLHYSLGTMRNGQFRPAKRFVHHISGTDFMLRNYNSAGSTDITRVNSRGSGWHKGGEWEKITVWLPARELKPYADNDKYFIKLEGFGNLQPSFIMQGLYGNGPGEGYAVRNLSQIRYGQVKLDSSKPLPENTQFAIRPMNNSTHLVTTPDLAGINDWIEQYRKRATGLTNLLLRITTTKKNPEKFSWTIPVSFISLPEKPEISCTWHPTEPETLLFTNQTQARDPRFVYANATAAGHLLTVKSPTAQRLTAPLPRTPSLTRDQTADTFEVSLQMGDQTADFSMAWNSRSKTTGPVLFQLENLSPLCTTFEDGKLVPALRGQPQHTTLKRDNRRPNYSLAIKNAGLARRLNCQLGISADLAQFPLLHFKYRASDMANVSLQVNSRHWAHLSEDYDSATKVQFAPETLSQDDQWHAWTGLVAGAVRNSALRPHLLTTDRLCIRSAASRDQTGLYSHLLLDDAMLGPAVASGEKLQFTPAYYDRDGIKRIEWALATDSDPYEKMDQSARETLNWIGTRPDTPIIPEIKTLTDGLHWLLLRASDANGNKSTVTSIPFLLDRQSPVINGRINQSQNPEQNFTSMTLEVDTHKGAPVDYSQMAFKWGAQALESYNHLGSQIQRKPDGDVLDINWAYLFRQFLNHTEDGEEIRLGISGLKDGAGNPVKPLRIKHKIDHAADKTPPALLPVKYPDNILWACHWESPFENDHHIRSAHSTALDIVHPANDNGFVQAVMRTDDGRFDWNIYRHRWKIADYPMLALRLRLPKYNSKVKLEIILQIRRSPIKLQILLSGEFSEKEMASRVSVPEFSAFEDKQWHGILINVENLLREKLQEHYSRRRDSDESASGSESQINEIMSRARGWRLQVQGANISGTFPILIQSLFIYKPWEKDNIVKLDAFDASGISGYSVGSDQTAIKPLTQNVKPAAYIPDNSRQGWLPISISDKAGNRRQIYIPVGFKTRID